MVAIEIMKGPTHMVEGGHHLRKPPTPTQPMQTDNMVSVGCHPDTLQQDPNKIPSSKTGGLRTTYLVSMHTDLVRYAMPCPVG